MAVSGGVPKEEFLRSVRQALGRAHSPPDPAYPLLKETLPDLETQAAAIRRRLAEDPTALMEKLASLAQLGGWNVYRAPGYEEAIGHIASLASSLGVESLVRTDQPIFESFPVDTALESLGLTVTTVAQGEGRSRESLRERIIAAGMGLTGADYAVAETGSVVIVPRKGLSRLVSLVPPGTLGFGPDKRCGGDPRSPLPVAPLGIPSAGRRYGELLELYHRSQPYCRHRANSGGGGPRA